ncbi:MAG: hypothetical protein QG628_1041 [Patescibacteria group bacterium]|mgnify:CR=1 FL=1|jgi:hypothetical protein|nr:hypothetical protein [Patescibacteria group bacterium]
MADNNEWLQRVAFKLNQLHMNGSDFVEELWLFDWDDNLSKADNFKNIGHEERALTTLTQVGAIQTIWKENFYRDQHWESMERHGWSMWNNWDTADPALKLYDNIWYVVGFDYKSFMKFCETRRFDPDENPMPRQIVESNGSDSNDVAKIYLAQKTLKLTYKGVTRTLKRFNSKKRI